MSVGEKIQYYRKKIGLSQDELGKKLLVSRQTVSLWEVDKTLPTVDNLLRLKEIFGVSIDDILSNTAPTEAKNEESRESYKFEFSVSELKGIFGKTKLAIIVKTILFSVICVFLFIAVNQNGRNDMALGFVFGVFLLGLVLHVKVYFAYRKTAEISAARVHGCTYFYEVYEDCFVVKISKNEETVKTHRVYFSDIEKVSSFSDYLVLDIAGQSYIIKKAYLSEDSAFHSCFNPQRAEQKKLQGVYRKISIALVVCSVASLWGALMGVNILSVNNGLFLDNMWVFFLFTPIPVASVAFGIYLKKKGYKYKKNIVVGIIMTALLCIYGSFVFIFGAVYSHSEEPILMIEETFEIDLPPHSQINTQDWTEGTQSALRGYIFSTSDIYFDKDEAMKLEETLATDGKWLTAVPNGLIGITSHFCDFQSFDYLIIYNVQTKEFNSLPKENGTYRLINILYNSDSSTMKLVEYEIDYTK